MQACSLQTLSPEEKLKGGLRVCRHVTETATSGEHSPTPGHLCRAQEGQFPWLHKLLTVSLATTKQGAEQSLSGWHKRGASAHSPQDTHAQGVLWRQTQNTSRDGMSSDCWGPLGEGAGSPPPRPHLLGVFVVWL